MSSFVIYVHIYHLLSMYLSTVCYLYTYIPLVIYVQLYISQFIYVHIYNVMVQCRKYLPSFIDCYPALCRGTVHTGTKPSLSTWVNTKTSSTRHESRGKMVIKHSNNRLFVCLFVHLSPCLQLMLHTYACTHTYAHTHTCAHTHTQWNDRSFVYLKFKQFLSGMDFHMILFCVQTNKGRTLLRCNSKTYFGSTQRKPFCIWCPW